MRRWASVSLSLNPSAIYVGRAIGASAGSLVIAHGAVGQLEWVAVGFGVAGLLVMLASRDRT